MDTNNDGVYKYMAISLGVSIHQISREGKLLMPKGEEEGIKMSRWAGPKPMVINEVMRPL